MTCSARFATAATGRPHLGGKIGRVAAALGTPSMPWQAEVAATGTELDAGRLRYRQVVVLVPRQSGKTSLGFAWLVAGCLGRPRTRAVFAAQTRLDARERMLDDWAPAIERSRLAPLVTARRGFGAEALVFANGSRITLVSGTRVAGHGPTLDMIFVDEAWSQVDDRLEVALRPTMITRPDPQWLIMSTAGDDTSTWLRAKVDAGRAGAESGQDSAGAYFEWSAPGDADPGDPATWAGCMPALGHTATVAAVRADYQLMPGPAFRRSYLNQWDAAAGGWTAFSREAWESCGYPR